MTALLLQQKQELKTYKVNFDEMCALKQFRKPRLNVITRRVV